MNRIAVTRWIDLVLGDDRHQRLRAKQSLVAASQYVGLAVIFSLAVWLGLVDWRPVVALSVGGLGGAAVFYALIRSGYNLRWRADPALMHAQTYFSLLAGVAGYCVAGPVRGVMLVGVMVSLVFGVFSLTPREARRMSLLVVAVFGATMILCASINPARYPPREELMHFLMIALNAPITGWLAGQLSAIREKLRQHRAQLEAALAQNRLLATQDELTGLSNRRHMMTLIVAERARQQRSRAAICMVLVDIDYFKRINDTHGHQAGDQVLQVFTDVITHGLRAGDALARWGGEEFLLMLPNTQASEALVCVERMRVQLAARNLDPIAPGLSVTFSAGIGVCQVEDRMEAVIERADKAMYQAKADGRNRSVVA